VPRPLGEASQARSSGFEGYSVPVASQLEGPVLLPRMLHSVWISNASMTLSSAGHKRELNGLRDLVKMTIIVNYAQE